VIITVLMYVLTIICTKECIFPATMFATRQVIHDPEQKLLILVMEFMPGGPILSSSRMPGLATEPLPEPAARIYFR
jgi:hypothetical protein